MGGVDIVTDATMMITALRAVGAELWVESGRLRVRVPTGALTPEWRRTLAAHRDAVLVALIAEADAWAMDRLDTVLGDDGLEPQPLPKKVRPGGAPTGALPLEGDARDARQRVKTVSAICVEIRGLSPIDGQGCRGGCPGSAQNPMEGQL